MEKQEAQGKWERGLGFDPGRVIAGKSFTLAEPLSLFPCPQYAESPRAVRRQPGLGAPSRGRRGPGRTQSATPRGPTWVTTISPQVPQPGFRHAFRLRPRHGRLPRAPAALLPALALAAPGELRARHQPHACCCGGARARAPDPARGLLPQRERGRPAPPARRAPAPGAAGRTQRHDDPRPAPQRARHGPSQAAAALGPRRRGTSAGQGPPGGKSDLVSNPSPSSSQTVATSQPQFPCEKLGH